VISRDEAKRLAASLAGRYWPLDAARLPWGSARVPEVTQPAQAGQAQGSFIRPDPLSGVFAQAHTHAVLGIFEPSSMTARVAARLRHFVIRASRTLSLR